jgi:hypothetical protein
MKTRLLLPTPVFPGSPTYLAELAHPFHQCALSPIVRIALIAVACVGTLAYGTHLYRLLSDEGLAWVGPGIAGGAAAAWVVLLGWLVLFVRDRREIAALGDHAIVTLTLGMVWVLSALAATTLFTLPVLATHAALLGVGNVLMGSYFIACTPSAVLSRRGAAVIWIGLMNGVLMLGLALTALGY